MGSQQFQVETSTILTMPYNTIKTRPMQTTVKQFKNKGQQKQKILKAVKDKDTLHSKK